MGARVSLFSGDWTVTKPTVEALVWKHTHKDYRGFVRGKRSVLVLGERGTTLQPLDSMSREQLLSLLPSASRARFQ